MYIHNENEAQDDGEREHGLVPQPIQPTDCFGINYKPGWGKTVFQLTPEPLESVIDFL